MLFFFFLTICIKKSRVNEFAAPEMCSEDRAADGRQVVMAIFSPSRSSVEAAEYFTSC